MEGAPSCGMWGANVGEWALEIAPVGSNLTIHRFEIIPEIRKTLRANTKDHPNIGAYEFGFSDSAGNVTVHWNLDHDTTSSISPRFGGFHFQRPATPLDCEVTTMDLARDRIEPPAFLKIDVEGHELAVLRGGQHLLSSADAPAIIQIEYGETFIPTGSTLQMLYDLVQPHGYSMGRFVSKLRRL
jgi:FkbM family methyltransferase